MAASIVFKTGHTFGPSMLYPVYRLVIPSQYLPQELGNDHCSRPSG